jgi:hypothetical protein
LAFTPHVKALGLISEFQPMRSTDFDNLKQQNGLDSSCKAALHHNILNQHWEGTLASPNMQQTRKIKNRNVEPSPVRVMLPTSKLNSSDFQVSRAGIFLYLYRRGSVLPCSRMLWYEPINSQQTDDSWMIHG